MGYPQGRPSFHAKPTSCASASHTCVLRDCEMSGGKNGVGGGLFLPYVLVFLPLEGILHPPFLSYSSPSRSCSSPSSDFQTSRANSSGSSPGPSTRSASEPVRRGPTWRRRSAAQPIRWRRRWRQRYPPPHTHTNSPPTFILNVGCRPAFMGNGRNLYNYSVLMFMVLCLA